MGNYFNYMRISTKEERGIQKYNRQEKSIAKYAKENGIDFVIQFKEDASAKNFKDRKEWQKLDKLLQNGDTVVFKDISRFTRETENGYKKYMELMNRGVNIVFIDNPTVSTDYIKKLLNVAQEQNLVARTSLENTVKLLLLVELDRVEQERLIFVQRVKDGLAASPNKGGRKKGHLDKMSKELEADIQAYLADRQRKIKQTDIMKKYNLSRNTVKKYIAIVDTQNQEKQNTENMKPAEPAF